MPSLVIKNLPPDLHRKLKERARRHHRSMTKEAVAILARALAEGGAAEALSPPYEGRLLLTQDLLDRARWEGRA